MSTTVSGVGLEEYSRESGIVRGQFDQEKTPVSTVIVALLAEATDTDPLELTPLYTTVDPDALDALVRVHGGTEGDTHVAFTHEGHEIRVHSYGVVTVSLLEHEPTAERGSER